MAQNQNNGQTIPLILNRQDVNQWIGNHFPKLSLRCNCRDWRFCQCKDDYIMALETQNNKMKLRLKYEMNRKYQYKGDNYEYQKRVELMENITKELESRFNQQRKLLSELNEELFKIKSIGPNSRAPISTIAKAPISTNNQSLIQQLQSLTQQLQSLKQQPQQKAPQGMMLPYCQTARGRKAKQQHLQKEINELKLKLQQQSKQQQHHNNHNHNNNNNNNLDDNEFEPESEKSDSPILIDLEKKKKEVKMRKKRKRAEERKRKKAEKRRKKNEDKQFWETLEMQQKKMDEEEERNKRKNKRKNRNKRKFNEIGGESSSSKRRKKVKLCSCGGNLVRLIIGDIRVQSGDIWECNICERGIRGKYLYRCINIACNVNDTYDVCNYCYDC